MYISNVFTNSNLCVKKQNEVGKVNEQTSISELSIKKDKVSSTVNNSQIEYPTEFYSLVDLSTKITNNSDLLAKLNAGELTSLALTATSKVFSIIINIKSSISAYTIQLNALQNNPFLSPEELRSQAELISSKIKALAQEGQSKAMELYTFSEVIVSLYSTFMSLNNAGVKTSEITNMFKQMLTNVDTKPSDFDKANDKSDLKDILKDNKKIFFGENANEMFERFIKRTKEKIQINENSLKDKSLSDEERNKISKENILYKASLKLFESFKK